MKPEYEKYRSRKAAKDPASARLPEDLKAEGTLYAEAEGDSLSGLLIEGLARVVEDRRQDPELVARIQETLARKESELEEELSTTRTLLESYQATDLPK